VVLTRRWGVFGVALCAVLSFAGLAGCNQSLFDAHGAVDGGGGGGSDSTVVPATCPAPCLADAAGDFDGTAGGKTMLWRYLDDHRDRTWAPMTVSATMMTGADPANHITTCTAHPDAPACKALPGALLVSSAGATSAADPALEFTATTNQVLQLSLHAFVPGGANQAIRIYRNSREDVLFTGIANVGTAFDQAVTLDALAGDRFLVAVAPAGLGATDVGLHVFVSATGASFPSSCQIAMTFSAAAGNTVDNLCGNDFTHSLYNNNTDTSSDTPPTLAAGPFPELGKAADFPSTSNPSIAYFHSMGTLDKSHDITVQFWVKFRTFVDTFDSAWLFSDLDLNNTGGLGVAIVQPVDAMSPPTLDVTTCTVATQTTLKFADAITTYPNDGSWQFVRIVHTGGNVYVCLNGTRKANVAVAPGLLQSTFPPYLGKNVVWTPAGAFFDGELDDVRVLTGALPCDP